VCELRIAHVQPMTLDLFGHDEAQLGRAVRYSVPNLAVAQAEHGDRPTLHLLTAHHARELEFAGVRAVLHPCVEPRPGGPVSSRFARQFSARLLRSLRREEADVVHFHGVRQLHLMYAATAARAGHQGIPLVAQDRGQRPVGRIETAAQRFALRRSQAVLASSADGARRLAALGVRESSLEVVPNGFDPRSFFPSRNGNGSDPGSAQRPFRLLVVSRLEPEKDPFTMTEAVIRLASRIQGTRLTVVSGGRLKCELQRRLRDGGVKATFFDHLPQADLGQVYRSADVLIFTASNQGEGWTQAVVEAMACGLPVVSVDVPGPRDALGDAGLLVPPGDPAALANALEGLAANPALRRSCRERGLARARRFTWEAVAARVRRVYEEVT
jgi:glycosyltransferase involved in cell wall biosynthesis